MKIKPNEFLKTILLQKKQEVAQLYQDYGLEYFQKEATKAPNTENFYEALKKTQFNLIAEVKKASPSKGIIRKNFNPVAIASSFKTAGAAAISVLTDQNFFQGNINYLKEIQKKVNLPLLRKDFIIDPIQIYEAKAAGAAAILLIAAILTKEQAVQLLELAQELNLDVLFEVHNEAELKLAIELDQLKIIGINNRDLNTFDVDIKRAENLKKTLKKLTATAYLIVAESGYNSLEQLQMLKEQQFNAVLIGEGLATNPEIIKNPLT